MMLKRRALALLVGVGLLTPGTGLSFSVTSSDAAAAAQGFARQGRGFGVALGSWAERTTEHATADGATFFAVKMYGGGTVFTAGDTETEPILAFTSATNDFSTIDSASPLAALIGRNLAQRLASRPLAWRSTTSARWEELMAAAPACASSGTGSPLETVSDVRVAPIVASRWSQSTVSTTAGSKACYNYYTPRSATTDDPGNAKNAVCGCVATAMAQIMRYHAFPRTAVPPVTNDCWFGSTRLSREMTGGPYDWDRMTLCPGTTETTEENRQAIGRLTSDAGVSVNMQYTANSSAALTDLVPRMLTDVFGYAQAHDLLADDGYGGIVAEATYQRTLLANFDAHLPVILGIYGNNVGGHCIVGDGYGYAGDELYVHLNMGWGGQDDVWYNLPNVASSSYTFQFVDTVGYNIQPERSGALLTGRVLDADGNAVAGADVAIRSAATDTVVTNLVTSATGIYAAVLPAGSYVVLASTSEPTRTGSSDTIALTAASEVNQKYRYESPDGLYDDYLFRFVRDEAHTGNSWGNDIVVYSDRLDLTVGAAGADVLLSDASPGAGAHVYDRGATVTLTAPALVLSQTNAFGVSCFKHACLGWTNGTGGVPASGTTNEVTVTLTGDATIDWVYDTTPAKALQRTFVSTFDYALYNGSDFYTTFRIEDLWRDYAETVSYALPQDAAWTDPYALTCYYQPPNMPSWYYRFRYEHGTLNLRLCAVELSVPGQEGAILYDAARHYAMPTNVSFVADHGQDVVFYYLPDSDMWTAHLPSWWVYRTMVGAKEKGIITSEQTGDAADPDGDGLRNLTEYRRGTDPMDAASVLRVPAAFIVK